MLTPTIVDGNLLDQDVDVIVNAWNQNIFPWWLLIPQGVSRAIKKRAGYRPFNQLWRNGYMKLGSSFVTDSGKEPKFKYIIHVAGINLLWRATEYSIRECIRTSIAELNKTSALSIAYPLIGAGTGSFNQQKSLDVMLDEFAKLQCDKKIVIVRFNANR